MGGAGGRRGVGCVEGGIREPVAFAAFGHEGRGDARHAFPLAEKSASGDHVYEYVYTQLFLFLLNIGKTPQLSDWKIVQTRLCKFRVMLRSPV